jgi:hypothetical protein
MGCNCRHVFALLCVFVLLAEFGCQEQAKTPVMTTAAPAAKEKEVQAAPAAGQGAPQLTFESVVYDFGEVSPGKTHTGRFTLTNTGAALLKITEVKKCCGAVVDLDQEELVPGESASMEVQYHFSGSGGTMTRQLHVLSNDPANPDVALTIKAKIVPKVVYEPQRLELLAKGPNAGCPPITIISIDNRPFSITGFKSSRDCVAADFDPSVEATKFVLQPTVDFAKLQGASAGLITIELTHPDTNRVSIYFSSVPPFKITPQSLIVANPQPQTPVVRKVLVRSSYNEDFEVESSSSKNGFTKLLDQRKTANGCQLDVEITPPTADATGKFDDLLYLNLKGGEKLQIKAYGRFAKEMANVDKTGKM